MTSWILGYRKTPTIRQKAPAIYFSGVTTPSESIEFKGPSIVKIEEVQKENINKVQRNAAKENPTCVLIKGATWIPDEELDLKLRPITI